MSSRHHSSSLANPKARAVTPALPSGGALRRWPADWETQGGRLGARGQRKAKSQRPTFVSASVWQVSNATRGK